MLATATRQLGRTNLQVSVLGFGGHTLGSLPIAFPDAKASEAVHRAHAAGLRLFDTAPNYGRGLSEHRIGHVLRAADRNSFVLSTKVGHIMTSEGEPVDVGLGFRGAVDLSGDATRRSLADSLQRLGLTRIDIALIHDVDLRGCKTEDVYRRRFREAMDGAYPVLRALRDDGVIRAIGVGLNDVDACLDFLNAGDFDCIMVAGRYSLLDHRQAADMLLPLCAERGIGVLLAAPYNSGILATGAHPGARFFYDRAPPDVLRQVARLETVCARHKVPLAAAAIQFPLRHPAVTSVVVGAGTAGEVERNIDLLSVPIPAGLWSDLQHENLIAALGLP